MNSGAQHSRGMRLTKSPGRIATTYERGSTRKSTTSTRGESSGASDTISHALPDATQRVSGPQADPFRNIDVSILGRQGLCARTTWSEELPERLRTAWAYCESGSLYIKAGEHSSCLTEHRRHIAQSDFRLITASKPCRDPKLK